MPKKREAPDVGKEAAEGLPKNLDAERAVLGAVIVSNPEYERVARYLTANAFHVDKHRRIYEAIGYLLDVRRSPVDFLTLRDELERRSVLGEVGGVAYIASLTDGVPKSSNVEYYARIVREKAQLRAIIHAANAALSAAYTGEQTPAEIMASTESALLAAAGHTEDRMAPVSDSVRRIFEDLEWAVANRGELRGTTTGFAALNEQTLGWRRGDLVVVAARPSIGKTSFVLASALGAAKTGKHVAFFSLEMRRNQIENRLLSIMSGVALSRIDSGYLGKADYAKLTEALEVFRTLPIFIDDQARRSWQSIRRSVRALLAQRGVDLVVIDYLQLMQGSLEKRGATRNEEIAVISRELKVMADDFGVPILVLSQLSRAAEGRANKRPQLTDLRDSGSIEQDADTVIMLHRDEHKSDGPTTCAIEKARNGPTGEVMLMFTAATTTYADMPPETTAQPAVPAVEPAQSTRRRGRG